MLFEFGLTAVFPREHPNPWDGIRAATQSLFTPLDDSVLPVARTDLKNQKANEQSLCSPVMGVEDTERNLDFKALFLRCLSGLTLNYQQVKYKI